jgi:arginyl-tRNA synthetase
MIRNEIKKLIERAAIEAGFRITSPVKISRPTEESHGDYSTSFALQAAKNFKMAPQHIAENLKSHLLVLAPNMFERIEVVEPGFLNFFISKEYFQKQILEIIKQKEKFGQLEVGSKEKVNLEFISANPTGQLHIGNGRSAFAGDVLANVLIKAGYKVVKEYFINNTKRSKQIRELGSTALGKGTSYLSEYLAEKIKKFQPKLKKIKDETAAGVLLAADIQKDNKQFIEKKLNIKFDKWVSEEKEIYGQGRLQKILDWLKNKELAYQKDGAWWIKTCQFGDTKDWVIVRESGEPTYLLSDIAYHKDKIDRGFSKIIDIWGADHQAHVSKMEAVARILEYQGDFKVLVLQLVTLKGGEKISKRKGGAITLEELVDDIGLPAARFFYLQKSLDTHMDIDLTLAKEQSAKNPVYYVQYAHARICSILEKAKAGKKFSENLLVHPSELKLAKKLIMFSEIVEDTSLDYQLQRLPQYVLELSTVFHQFYHDCRVISENKKLTKARLALVLASKIVLKNTLDLMGIAAPQKM